MGRTLAERGIGLVYGGGSVGLMGAVADAALEAGGEVVGVIPRALAAARARAREAHDAARRRARCTSARRRWPSSPHGFVALPGGMGTLEEFAEVLTWAQLGLHARPCGLLDVAGYYQPLIAFFDRARRRGVRPPRAPPAHGRRRGRRARSSIGSRAWQPPVVERWIDTRST